MATYLGLVKLGTLRNGTTIKPRPTLPWQIGSEPYTGAGVGNIADFSANPSITNWNIGNTDANDANKLQWHKIQDGAKTLLICDRVILVNISWDDLNADNRVFGKTIVIDGQQYKLRLLTGGAEKRGGGAGGSANGGKTPNEWDRFITNEDAISGLSTPTAGDFSIGPNATQKNGVHNQSWNWVGVWSWCQETYTYSTGSRAQRGYISARYWNVDLGSDARVNGFGWRPVLELMNQPPTISLTSPSNNQTLSEGNTYKVEGSATDVDANNNVVIKYQINNGPIRNAGSGVSNGSTPISFSRTLTYTGKRMWDGAVDVAGADLAENVDHALDVWAEDDQGGKSAEVTRKFRVIWNRPPVISGSDKNLGTISAAPSESYSVTEPENDTFTITELLNGQQIRSFAGAVNQQYTITIDKDRWLQLPLGVQHELRVRATDSKGQYSDRIYTFIRSETQILFKLKQPFLCDAKPTRVLVTLDGVFPSGSNVKVEVCNNAYDAVPTYEDATGPALAGRGYIFINSTKTAANWGINIRITINKGTSTDKVILNGFGGAFD